MWRTVKLGDVCKIVNGSTPSRKEDSFWEDGDISWFTIDDMREQGRDIFTTAQHVTQRAVEEKKVKLVPENSVLLCCTASIGEAAIARKAMATNQQFNSLTPLKNDLSCEYLYYVATTLKDKLLRVSGSTTISFVSMGKLKEVEIQVPPLAEQQRIVSKLDAAFAEIDKAIELAEVKNAELEKLKANVLKNLLSGGDWQTVKLKDICSVFADGDWIETKHQSLGGIRLIQTGNVKIGNFADRKDKARYISEETFNQLNCTAVREGDLLVSRLPEPVGRACMIPKLKAKAVTAVDCTIIRTKEFVLPTFLNYYMQSPRYFSAVQEKVTGATRQRISRKNLGEIDIQVPTLAEQQRIVAKLDAAYAEIDIAKKSVITVKTNYAALKSAILVQELKPSEAA